MANIKSQIKRNRQNDKRRLANRVHRGVARSAVKDARTAINAGAAESKEELMKAISALDKAAEKGVIHKNNAARRKSRLMKAFAGMKPAEVKVEEPVPVAQPEAEATPKRASRAKAEKSQAEKPEKKAASPRKKPAAE